MLCLFGLFCCCCEFCIFMQYPLFLLITIIILSFLPSELHWSGLFLLKYYSCTYSLALCYISSCVNSPTAYFHVDQCHCICWEWFHLQSGVFQVLEQGLISQCPAYQLPLVAGALVTSFDTSRSSQMLAFGDSCGRSFVCPITRPLLWSSSCSASSIQLDVSSVKLSTYRACARSCFVPAVWKSLPAYLWDSSLACSILKDILVCSLFILVML